MARIRTTTVVTLLGWAVGALFALWLASSAKTTAMLASEVGRGSWTGFLNGVPWLLVWLVLAAALALLAWASASVARKLPLAAYAYVVFVVVVLAALFWASVILPTGSFLAQPL